jgi:hypothetical protein
MKKRCSRCGRKKSTLSFNSNRAMPDGLGAWCRTCVAKKRTPEYRAWCSMRERCRRQKNQDYARYGKRGIRVCTRWHTFALFLKDVGRRPSPKHSIDRIDNDGNYEPGNVRWATPKTQQGNKGTRVSFRGELRTKRSIASELKLSDAGIAMRLKRGWSEERAFTTPKGARL